MTEGERVKFMLYENHLTQVWLISRLERYGIITDKAELSSSLSGARKGKKVDEILYQSVKIVRDYERKINREE